MKTQSAESRFRSPRAQRGVSLFVVLVMVLLTTLMTLWAARTAMFNELVTGNDSDYQRALEAAHALVRDAEFDILGVRPDNALCATTVGFTNCRPAGLLANIDVATRQVFFPPIDDIGITVPSSVLMTIAAGLDAAAAARLPDVRPSCVAAICITGPNLDPQFWNTPSGNTGLDKMQALGATYGQYTGANAAAQGNPLLAMTPARAHYWVEPLRYQSQGLRSQASRDYSPRGPVASGSAQGIVYRITAVAQGMKPGTQAVVQVVFVPKESSL